MNVEVSVGVNVEGGRSALVQRETGGESYSASKRANTNTQTAGACVSRPSVRVPLSRCINNERNE